MDEFDFSATTPVARKSVSEKVFTLGSKKQSMRDVTSKNSSRLNTEEGSYIKTITDLGSKEETPTDSAHMRYRSHTYVEPNSRLTILLKTEVSNNRVSLCDQLPINDNGAFQKRYKEFHRYLIVVESCLKNIGRKDKYWWIMRYWKSF